MNKRDREKRKKELRKIIDVNRDELHEIEDGERAEYDKQFIGRCFRYRNSYSVPTEDEKWRLYTKVISVGETGLTCLSFQEDYEGKIEIEPGGFQYSGNLEDWQEITEDHYRQAWLELVDKISGIQ